MKHLKNFLIKREQSQARLRFAKCEKSRLLARTLLTLVALLAVTTQAWAAEPELLVTINSKDYTSFKSGSMTFDDKVTITFSSSVGNDGDDRGWFTFDASLLTVAGINGYTITSCKFYTLNGTAANGYTVEGESPSVYLNNTNVYTNNSKSVNIGTFGVKKIEVYGTGPTPVPLTQGTGEKINEWTLTNKMPAGNVTVNVNYFPKAEFAANGAPTAITGVAATTDNPIVTPGTVKNIGTSEVKQGTLMYYASQTAMTDADLLALTANQWSADVPTASDLAKGNAYVYYYIQGAEPAQGTDRTDANTCSDGDILATNVVNVTLGDAPLWNAEFDLTNVPEEDKAPGVWSTSITGEGVIKGTNVTVTYSGTKKILGVKAEKKAAPVALNITSPSMGQVIGSDGKNYNYTSLPSGVTAVAKICYVSGSNGLALALTDEGQMNWSTAQTTCAAHTPAFSGGTWKLANNDEWGKMIDAVGGYQNLRGSFDFITGASNMQSADYWSDTAYSPIAACYRFGEGSWGTDNQNNASIYVRACLAF